MADAETRGRRLCLEIIIIVQKRDDEAQSQVDLGQVCVCVWWVVKDMRDAKELTETGPGP